MPYEPEALTMYGAGSYTNDSAAAADRTAGFKSERLSTNIDVDRACCTNDDSLIGVEGAHRSIALLSAHTGPSPC